jgi:hypothetical protein
MQRPGLSGEKKETWGQFYALVLAILYKKNLKNGQIGI